jgi:Trypsin-co-occurring domain 1
MSQLQPLQVEDGTVIYIETTDRAATTGAIANSEETTRSAKGWGSPNPSSQVSQSFQAIESTIKTYTKHTLNAFRDAAMADVKKVTLEFGVNVSGMSGIPYIATGTAACNIKVVVECEFLPQSQEQGTIEQIEQ